MRGKSKLILKLEGLTCANCVNKIEERVNSFAEVREANLIFAKSILKILVESEGEIIEVEKKIVELVSLLEPHVKVSRVENTNRTRKVKEDIDIKNKNIIEIIKKIIDENYRLIIGILLLTLGMMSNSESVSIGLFIVSYVVIGQGVLLTAIKNIGKGHIFDENFLMTIATIGALAIGEYTEGIAVLLLYEIGEIFQRYAVDKSRKSISDLMDIKVEYANLIKNDEEVLVTPEDIKIDDIILVKPGEKIPLDGIVISGKAFVDTSTLTGESVPRKFEEGDSILAGYINTNGLLKIKVTKLFEDSTVSKVLELVENAASKKAKTERFITKFSKIYTPIVVTLAIGIAVVPSMVFGWNQFDQWLYRALTFLVVSCPCALVISVPLGMFAGIGGASRKGVLVKGGNYLEALKNIDTLVFDKTGTLTEGIFKVAEIVPNKISKDELLELVAIGESKSNHPIATSIIKEFGKEIDDSIISEYTEISGYGISVIINGSKVLLGNNKLMESNDIAYGKVNTVGTIIHVSKDKEYLGYIIIADKVKREASKVISRLKSIGIKETVMLTGDRANVAEAISKEIGIDKYYSELLPNDKVDKIEELLEDNKVAFVGDGINDAPVLARANVGIAMGKIGSDAAIEAADVVLMTDDLFSIIKAIKIAKKTSIVLWQNIILSLGIKFIVLILGATGEASMWQAIFADVGVSIIAILNSYRCIK